MKIRNSIAALAGIAIGALVSGISGALAAQVSPIPTTNTSSAVILTNGSVQTVLADNPFRTDCMIQNEDSTITIAITDNGDTPAVGGLGYQLSPGSWYNCNNGISVSTQIIKIIGTTGKPVYATESVARGQ